MSFDIKNLARNLQKTLTQLDKAKNEALTKNLPPEALEKLRPISTDLARVMNASRKGDVTELNKMISKYANIN